MKKIPDSITQALHKTGVQHIMTAAVALVVVGSVAYFGTNTREASEAAVPAPVSLYMSPEAGTYQPGSNISVAVRVNAGTTTLNAVQAALTYDATALQYVSMTEGTAFSTIAATSTETPGVIRVGRAAQGSTPSGDQLVVTINFKALNKIATTNLAFDKAYSFAVRSTDSTDVLATTAGAAYNIKLPAPTISTVSPTTGPAAGNTALTISGTNFVSGATVTVGGTAATNVVVTSATQITATAPAHAAGTVSVVVTNPDGQAATKASAYTYRLPAPTLSTVTPTSGLTTGGTRITLTGTNFVRDATVKVGAVSATDVVFVSATQMTALAPAQAAGLKSVTVTNPDGQTVTKTAAYTYNNLAPTITAVNPTTSLVGGGTSVTITGANFISGATVMFGPTPAASVTFVSSTQLTVVTPQGTPGGKELVVTNPDGQSSGGVAPIFTYLSNPGDANADGRVNALDLSVVITRDGQNYPPADFNGDGTVGSADLAMLLARWTW